MTWSHPATASILATSFAVMGARDLSFLSMRAYGKQGITAVIRRALAILQAEIRMRSSIRLSLTSLQPDWMIKTSSSRTDSDILALISPLENFLTSQGTKGTLSLGYHGVNDGSYGPLQAANLEKQQLTARPRNGRARGDCCLQRGAIVRGQFSRSSSEGPVPVKILTELPCSMSVHQQVVLQHSMQRNDNVERMNQKGKG